MLQPATLQFLKNLQKNNNKPWFDKNRSQYETAKADILLLTECLISTISKFEPAMANLVAKDCTFRINRDVRFSKDKSPYKNNFACYFNKDGKKGNGAGYYLHIQPGKSFAGGGIWMPETNVLASIRQEIDYNYTEWKKMLSNSLFKKTFEKGIQSETSLSRPPKGYDELNPAIKYIKMKSFIVSNNFSDAELLSNNFVKNITKTFSTMKPLINFLNTAID